MLVWKGIVTRQAPRAEDDGISGGVIPDLERRRREILLQLRNAIFLDKAEDRVKKLEAEEEDLERRSARSPRSGRRRPVPPPK